MKKFLFLGAMAAMLLGTASCSKDMEPEMTDGTVQFKVELPGNIDSRVISDGTTAIKLDVACYDEDGNYLDIEPTIKTDFDNLEATVVYKLAKGQKYNFAFFAHCEDRTTNPDPYFSRTNRYLFEHGDKFEDCKFVFGGLHQTSDFANDEKRDAFYGTLTNYVLTSEETTVTLTRPFAQINIGTDDLQEAIASGIKPRNVRVEFSKVSKSFNIASGTASEDETETGWYYYYPNYDEEGNMPYEKNPAENLTVDGKDYTWISMNYILVPANEANINVKVKVHTTKTATGENGEDFTFDVNNVPIKKNHRTNIVGSLLTKDANLKVVINPIYEQPDYNVDPEATVFNVTSEDELTTAMNSGAKKIVINLMNDVDLHYTARVAYGDASTKDIIIDGNEHTLNLHGTNSDWNSFGACGDANLTIKNANVTYTRDGGGNNAWNNHAINFVNRAENLLNPLGTGKIYLKNCNFSNSIAISNDAEIEDCTFTEVGGFYLIMINANVNNTIVKNCTFSAPNGGRGIKVNDQYIGEADRVQCNINISDCSFETAIKGAIIITNTAGAKITASNLDITKVAADNVNAVWNDNKRTAAWDLIEVIGCTKFQELPD